MMYRPFRIHMIICLLRRFLTFSDGVASFMVADDGTQSRIVNSLMFIPMYTRRYLCSIRD